MRGKTQKISSVIINVFLCLFFFSCQPSAEKAKSVITSNPGVFELAGLTVGQLQQKMQDGEYTAYEITKMYLDRIRDIDQNGIALHAVIEINPDALTIAQALDEERANHKVRGPLHGIPVLIKDNIDTGDKMQTTAGSLAMFGNIASNDAFIIKKLRDAGAIILGKTNLTEWANFRSLEATSGWSSRGGQTKNPYILDLSPCGSSSGSAVAVSADLCALAVGTETDGSIGCPSSMNGVVGISPTVGLLSRTGLIPISKTMDTPGPIARTVSDAAILLSVMTGEDPQDKATKENKWKNGVDFTRYLQKDGLSGKRIGVEKSMMQDKEGIGAVLQVALEQLESKGAVIVEVEFTGEYNMLGREEVDVMLFEFKDGLNQYLKASNSPMRSLEDIIRFNKQYEQTMMPNFKQELLESAQAKGNLESEEYKNALSKLLSMRQYVDQLMEDNDLDALCGVGSGAFGPAAITGYPAITVPMGTFQDMPYGITFFARAFEEPKLLSIAYAYEQISKKRTSPTYIPNFNTK